MQPERVAIARNAAAVYPSRAPFAPGRRYLETPAAECAADANDAYDLVREVFLSLGLDEANAGTARWNPLGDLIRPGDRVVLKPNMVHHGSGEARETAVLLTHASVVRAVLDYALRALDGRGEITIGDAPLQSGDFSRIVHDTGLDAVVAAAAARASLPVRLVDFRQECVATAGKGGFITARSALPGEAQGYRMVDVAADSALLPIEGDAARFRVTDYRQELMRAHQRPGTHQYVIPRVILNADVVINLPKMKTHRKAALTCALKNLVGINGRKDCLPHHRKGSAASGGDEYQHDNLWKRLYSWCDEVADRIPFTPARLAVEAGKAVPKALARLLAEDAFFEGSWFGNDTLWRTVHDLNRVLLYADAEGRMGDRPARRVLHIVDAIVAGEGEGPLEPSPVDCGMLIGGSSALAVDSVAATVMGFDARRIPIVGHGYRPHRLPLGPASLEAIAVRLGRRQLDLAQLRGALEFHFLPPKGWQGQVEWRPTMSAAAAERAALGAA